MAGSIFLRLIHIKMCEVVLYGDHDFPQYSDGWSPDVKKKGLTHMKALESFEFIYSLSHSLLYLKDAAIKVQGKNADIVSGVSLVMQCCVELKTVREE